MKRLLLLLLLTFCSPVLKSTGVLSIRAANYFDMPPEAIDVAEYVVRISEVVTPTAPQDTLQAPDTLSIWFDYRNPDNLPEGELAYTTLYEKVIPNSQALWDEDQDANIKMKEWINLDSGNYQLLVTAKAADGRSAQSGRYEFVVIGPDLVKVFIQSVLK